MPTTSKHRLYPTNQRQRLLNQQWEECRGLYSHWLAERRDAWAQRQASRRQEARRQASRRLYDQQAALPTLKAERAAVAAVHAPVAQNVAVRLDLAMQAVLRRVRTGATPGYPRRRGTGRYDSVTIPQVPVGCRLAAEEKRIRVATVGQVKMVFHRPSEGTPKTATSMSASTRSSPSRNTSSAMLSVAMEALMLWSVGSGKPA
jgi:putative transposase